MNKLILIVGLFLSQLAFCTQYATQSLPLSHSLTTNITLQELQNDWQNTDKSDTQELFEILEICVSRKTGGYSQDIFDYIQTHLSIGIFQYFTPDYNQWIRLTSLAIAHNDEFFMDYLVKGFFPGFQNQLNIRTDVDMNRFLFGLFCQNIQDGSFPVEPCVEPKVLLYLINLARETLAELPD